MKYPAYNHNEIEPSILQFWKEKKVTENLRSRNKDGKKFYFLEGPPYTSGRIHMGTAWNMALKDILVRYKRMQGFNVWDRMGYDMHGLPTEQKVMKKFNLKNKDEIEEFGVKKFTEECEKFCIEMMQGMNEDFIRIGATLDFTDPYQPVKNTFMDAEWWLIKKAHEKGRLYQGLRTMHWDAATQSSVAKHELEYKSIQDTSIFVKFQDTNNEKRFFIIWTTTPWTIPLNLAIMVNPELDYVDVSVGDEIWVIAKELVDTVMKKAEVDNFTILEQYKGKDLEGQHYVHPLGVKEFLPQELQDNKKLFSILLSTNYVNLDAGTGLVHCAPGCGPEDYEVGHENNIPPFNCVNEEGLFTDFGTFSNWKAKTDDNKFIEAMDERGVLLAKEPYTHDYPHGERSHEPVIFRTTKQWFFKVEDLKEKMLAANEDIYWNPEGGKVAFTNWLENLRDNSITKQRYWGTPVPIWINKEDDSDFIVVGSITELEELSGKKVEQMHIPDIDDITITKDGKTFTRIPDVLDVWIDAGTTSWNCLNYPRETEKFEELFPADFILEGKDQIRGWFNLLMVASFLAFDRAPFKNVFMHGFLNDVGGVKMSKSLGNIIAPDDLIEKHGADVLRYYMAQTNAGNDINFSWDECLVKQRQLNILWNTQKLLLNLSAETGCNPTKLKPDNLAVEEKYILSKLHSTIKNVTELLDTYKIDEIIAPLEELYLELSRTYIQIIRDKSSVGNTSEKEAVVYTLYTVFINLIKMFSIVSPFVSEAMYQNVKEEFGLDKESVCQFTWPKFDENLIDENLEKEFDVAKLVIQSSLNAREKAKISLRWPVEEIIIEGIEENALQSLQSIIMTQVNCKKITVVKDFKESTQEIKADRGKIGKAFGRLSGKVIEQLNDDILKTIINQGHDNITVDGDKLNLTKDMFTVSREVEEPYVGASTKNIWVFLNTKLSDDLKSEGFSREVTRQVQALRKKSGLQKNDRIKLWLKSSEEMKDRLKPFKEEMRKKVGSDEFLISSQESEEEYEHSDTFSVKGEDFWAGMRKL
jgi:isoleucyl-tRNA synthetase